MLSQDKRFFYVTFNDIKQKNRPYLDELYKTCGPNARFYLNVARYFGKNRYTPRNGVWEIPWNIDLMPGIEMPKYDPSFSLSFAEITNLRAQKMREILHKNDCRLAVYYSGGIDSVLCLIAILKNFSAEELKRVDVALSAESVMEYPYFFEKHIKGKLNFFDSAKITYGDIQNRGDRAIISDTGDSIFGTEFGTKMYYMYNELLNKVSNKSRQRLENLYSKVADADVHYSEYADLLLAFLDLPRDPQFGKLFYEKIDLNIKTSTVPIQSLHDFFWWIIFNIKFAECSIRCSLYYYNGTDRGRALQETIINWFTDDNYQKWSMVNNNNGQKIRGSTAASYKWAAREYIYEYDKNFWYMRHKLKISSLVNIFERYKRTQDKPPNIFAIDKEYKLLLADDPLVRGFIEEALSNFG